MELIEVKEDILHKNDELAANNRKLLNNHGVFTINLVGSPGAGKTALLEELIARLKDKIQIGVIEGDLYTTKDAARIEAYDIPVIQVNTGGACHLEAAMIREALNELDLAELDLLVIENVGNLVCTASFDLSEDLKITVLSVTEGSDKPRKYPIIFRKSDLLVVNKLDLLEYTDFSLADLYVDVKALNDELESFEISCKDGSGIAKFCNYLFTQVQQVKLARSN
ncbi:hydrogenase nickel incorporation protein HypB [Acetohalobium arabaticum]|uniref:Hydrogenase accessory protein HypB n=1 Tax=Acetohalobium arabaticum (strain ATCC 49924 / DSM 5501 / Z-7288) TaxID=574087 RepID=D9QVE3_ACEAZ|nr:hydrogenase nickel incorporation protein HypB [Acetohalobium arabaticum]ADL12202.1 hydrogenase accessory protein HypB [Acetohalobium arabaticum DSM 5501]